MMTIVFSLAPFDGHRWTVGDWSASNNVETRGPCHARQVNERYNVQLWHCDLYHLEMVVPLRCDDAPAMAGVPWLPS